MTTVPSPRAAAEPACPQASPVLGQLVTLSGDLDVHSATDIRLALAAAVAAGTGDLVVDLADVRTVDVTGLGVLVGAHRQAGRHGRQMVLRDIPVGVGRLLLLTRLDRVLRVCRTSSA